MHSAELRVTLGDPRQADAVARSLAVEMTDAGDGVHVDVRPHGPNVVCRVRSQDAPGLRAAVTQFLRLAEAAGRTAALA